MVEADVALNFDLHSCTNTTELMPTNSPILPFIVLTMAAGCGVSNLMKRTGNNSWVCVEMGDGRGVKRVVVGGGESRHKCPCQDQTREGLTTTTSPKWHQSQLQEKRCRCLITENRHRHSSLLDWCELMRDPPDGQEGRAGLKKARVSWTSQQYAALGSSLLKLAVDSRAERHQVLLGF